MWSQVLMVFALDVMLQLQATEQVLYAAAPSERGAFHVGGSHGTYNYGYNTGDGIAKVEVRRADGSVVGSYRYFDATGKQIIRSYIADERGFRVLGNDLPISPNTQPVAIDGIPAFTAPVEGDTAAKYQSVPTQQFQSIVQPSEQLNTINYQNIVPNKESETLRKHEALLKKQQELILKQTQRLENLQRQYEQYQRKIQQNSRESPPQQTSQQISYTQGVPNVLSPYLLLPNKVNYDFPAGFAVKGVRRVIKRPIGVKGEHVFMTDYAAGHSVSGGHLHDPVGPHIETQSHYNPVTAGHSHIRRRGHYIIGHAR